jgi:hypothetical protein
MNWDDRTIHFLIAFSISRGTRRFVRFDFTITTAMLERNDMPLAGFCRWQGDFPHCALPALVCSIQTPPNEMGYY